MKVTDPENRTDRADWAIMAIERNGAARICNPPFSLMNAGIERAMRDYGWRLSAHDTDGAVTLSVSGDWSDYTLMLSMLHAQDSIEIACVFALAPPRARWPEIGKLAERMNRSFHRGILELRIEEDHGTYKDWVPMSDIRGTSGANLIDSMRSAVGTCDMMLFPAFHCVAWAEINAETALDSLNFGPAGYRCH